MRILFIYKFLTIGGVEAVLGARLAALSKAGIEAQAWFLEYIDGESIFSPEDVAAYIGGLPELRQHLKETSYDVLSVIDTPGLSSPV